MNEIYEVTVTQDDIKNSNPYSVRNCMVAIAAKRALDVTELNVGYNYVVLAEKLAYSLPKEVGAKIARHMAGFSIEPFSFVMEKYEY